MGLINLLKNTAKTGVSILTLFATIYGGSTFGYFERKSPPSGVVVAGFEQNIEKQIGEAIEKLWDICPPTRELELCIINYSDHNFEPLSNNVAITYSNLPISYEDAIGLKVADLDTLNWRSQIVTPAIVRVGENLTRDLNWETALRDTISIFQTRRYERDGVDIIAILNQFDLEEPSYRDIPDFVDRTIEGQIFHECAHVLFSEYPKETEDFLKELAGIDELYIGFLEGETPNVYDCWVSGYAKERDTRQVIVDRIKDIEILFESEKFHFTSSEIELLTNLHKSAKDLCDVIVHEEDGAETLTYIFKRQPYKVGLFTRKKIEAGEQYLSSIIQRRIERKF